MIIDSVNSDRSGMTIGITRNKNAAYYSSDICLGMCGYVSLTLFNE